MFKNLGKTIIDLIKITPGFIICFFGSYARLDYTNDFFEKNNIFKEIKKYKEFYCDTSDKTSKKNIFESINNSNKVHKIYFFTNQFLCCLEIKINYNKNK